MVFALMLAFFRNDFGFGGNNGLTDFKDILGYSTSRHRRRAMGLFIADWRWRSSVSLSCSAVSW